MTNVAQSSSWKKIEKFFGIVGFVAAIAAIFGVYYQFQNKKSEAQFVILSKDYLTVKNNIEGLESNFKIINSGDLTLIGTERESSLLDSIIVFQFAKNVQILDKLNLVFNNFPEHNLSRQSINSLSLKFKQWRPNESAVYSIYIKSDNQNPLIIPKTSRIIKDGNIIVDDLTNNKLHNKKPAIDHFLNRETALFGRILGIILASLLLLAILIYTFGIMLPQWFKLRRWLWKHSNTFSIFLRDFDISKISVESAKLQFSLNKEKYMKDPTTLNLGTVWGEWKKKGFEKVPDMDSSPVNWKHFWLFVLVISILIMCTLSIIFGLIIY